ncbi:MAG: flagellin [Phycisphaerales bacterium]
MSRINTNVSSLIATRVLTQNRDSLNTSLERLSTGLRINRGKDDPAGLIASQNLRAQKTSLGAAIGNAERADQVSNIAEGGLDEISSLLNEVQGLVTSTANTAGLSREEKEANQLKIDSILQTIDRVSSATSFQGTKLLNGNFDYAAGSVNTDVSSFKINGAKLGFGGSLNVDVVVTGSAQVGGFFLSFGGSSIDLSASSAKFTVELAGAKGSRELSFASGTTLTSIAAAVNSFTDVTGVKARVSGTTGIRLESDQYGSDQFVSVKVNNSGGLDTGARGIYNLQAGDADATTITGQVTFASASNAVKDSGLDVKASVNGITATTKGTKLRINTDFLDTEIDLNYNRTATGGSAAKLGSLAAFSITGGGADFQLAGKVDIAGKVSIGIKDTSVRSLGRITDGSTTSFLADLGSGRGLNLVDGDISKAQKAIDAAIKDVSSTRGRLGAFQQNTVGATIRSLNVSLENTTAAESVIRDVDFATETANLTRAQILTSSAQQILSLSNQQPQSALQLLG